MSSLSEDESKVLESIVVRGAIVLPRKGSQSLRYQHVVSYWTLDGLTLKRYLNCETDTFVTIFTPTHLAIDLFQKSEQHRGQWEKEPL